MKRCRWVTSSCDPKVCGVRVGEEYGGDIHCAKVVTCSVCYHEFYADEMTGGVCRDCADSFDIVHIPSTDICLLRPGAC